MPYKDAKKICEYLIDPSNPKLNDEVVKLFQEYPETSGLNTIKEIQGKLTDNILLNQYLKASVKIMTDAEKTSITGVFKSTQGAAPNFSILDPTIIADGFARFIAKRVREELTASFFAQFKNDVCTSTVATKVEKFLPQTKFILCNNDPLDYNIFLPALRNAFERDFIDAPDNLKQYLVSLASTAGIDDIKRKELITAIEFVQIIRSRDKLSKILGRLDNSSFSVLSSLNSEFANALSVTAIISRNIIGDNGEFLTTDNLNALGNETFRDIFFGLILLREKANLVRITSNSKTLYEILNTNFSDTSSRIGKLQIGVRDIVTKLNDIRDYVKAKGKPALSSDDVAQYIGLSLDVITSGIETFNTVYDYNTDQKMVLASVKKVREGIKPLQQLISGIQNKEWGVVAGGISQIVCSVLENTDENKKLKTMTARYTSFISGILSAKEPEDIEKILESVALPVGSWRLNREKSLHISINSYAGPMWSSSTKYFGKGNSNLLAPVGLSFSFRLYDFFKNLRESGNCWGWVGGILIPQTIHTPITDLGPIVNLRLNNANQELPALQWADLLAPGAYLIWNIPDIPISFGAGGQYSVQYSTTPSNQRVGSNEWRWNVFAGVDIPLFTLWAK